MTSRTKKYVIAAANVLLVVSLASVAIVFLLLGFVIYNPVSFHEKGFDQSVTWISTHMPSDAADVQLPRQLKRCSITGKAYVTGDYVFIPTWIGRHTLLPSMWSDDNGCEGYLYVKNKLTVDQPEGDVDQVTIYVPRFAGLVGINGLKGVKKWPMVVQSKVSSRWYYLESQPLPILEG